MPAVIVMADSGTVVTCRATVVVIEKFDAKCYLELIESSPSLTPSSSPPLRSHAQVSDEERAAHDLSSLQMMVHEAAPCPVEVKR